MVSSRRRSNRLAARTRCYKVEVHSGAYNSIVHRAHVLSSLEACFTDPCINALYRTSLRGLSTEHNNGSIYHSLFSSIDTRYTTPQSRNASCQSTGSRWKLHRRCEQRTTNTPNLATYPQALRVHVLCVNQLYPHFSPTFSPMKSLGKKKCHFLALRSTAFIFYLQYISRTQ